MRRILVKRKEKVGQILSWSNWTIDEWKHAAVHQRLRTAGLKQSKSLAMNSNCAWLAFSLCRAVDRAPRRLVAGACMHGCGRRVGWLPARCRCRTGRTTDAVREGERDEPVDRSRHAMVDTVCSKVLDRRLTASSISSSATARETNSEATNLTDGADGASRSA